MARQKWALARTIAEERRGNLFIFIGEKFSRLSCREAAPDRVANFLGEIFRRIAEFQLSGLLRARRRNFSSYRGCGREIPFGRTIYSNYIRTRALQVPGVTL